MGEKVSNKKENKNRFTAGGAVVYFLLGASVLLAAIAFWSYRSGLYDSWSDQKIVISTSLSTGASLLILADEKTFFTEEGVSVEVRYYSSAGKGLAAMLADEIPIAAVSETPLVKQSLSRNDFRIFSTISSSSNDLKIVARKSAGISKPGDLAGKKLGSTPPGQSAGFFLYLFLLQHNIALQDITLIHDSPIAITEMVSTGELDAVSIFEPYAAKIVKKLGPDATLFSSPGLYFNTYNLVAKPEFLAENSVQVQRILKALLKAEEFYRSFPEESLRIISARTNLTPGETLNLIDVLFLNINLSEELIITMQEEAGWMRETGLVPTAKTLPIYSDLVDANFLRTVAPGRIILTNN